MKTLIKLYYMFFKIGLFTIGGGYAMLPMLEKEAVEKNKLVTYEQMMDYYAIGQSTPGIIAINTATFIGYKEKGILGGIFATLGMVTPSLIIITFIAHFFDRIYEYEAIKNAFAGMRVCVVVLIINAAIRMGKRAVVDYFGYVIATIAFLLISFTGISPIIIITISAITGIIIKVFLKGDDKNRID